MKNKLLSFLLMLALNLSLPLQAHAALKAPDFSGTDLQGVTHTLAQYQGKPLILYFWATWCPACRRDVGNVNKLYQESRDKGIEFLAVSLDEDRKELDKYVTENKIAFPVLYEGKAWDNTIAVSYNIQATPSFVVITADQNLLGGGGFSDELRGTMDKLSSSTAGSLKVPDFTGTDLNGTVHTRAQYEGKPLVLYFWATWCPACRRDIGSVSKLYKDFHPRGIEFVSVSLDKEEAKLREYVASEKIEFPVLFDGKAWDNEVARAYAVNSTPTFVLIQPDHEGMVSGHWGKELKKRLQSL